MTKVTQLTLDEDGGLSRRRIHLREISGEADAPLETIGQDLRAARVRLGEDLATVSRALKIRKDHLEALEEDRFEDLPGRAYAVGFVRTYAGYLGLDISDCVERFKLEIAGRGSDGPPLAQNIVEERKLPNGWIAIALIVTALIVYGAYHFLTSSSSLANQPVAAVPQQFSPKAAQAHKSPPLHRVQTIAISSATAQTASKNAIQRVATKMPSAAVTSATTSTAVAPQFPKGRVYGAQNSNARVVLRLKSATQIRVEGPNGKVYINRALQPGDTYKVPLIRNLTLTTPNGSAVEIDLDGQAMGTASKGGETETLPLDPQSVADHANKAG